MRERELIEAITKLAAPRGKGLIKGIGDDCAVIEKTDSRAWLLTMDTLLESVHFDLSFHPPEKLGWKSVSVNVSDVAAMGGEPVFVLLSLGLPPDFDEAFFRRFSRGLTRACEYYGCALIGGDTVRSPHGLQITLTVIGEADLDTIVYRSTARPGDVVWVSGYLGSAGAGLELCRSGVAANELPEEFNSLVDAHLDPRARTELGPTLARRGLATAMMDLSDGLATDLAHICTQSGVGAVVDHEKLPGRPALFEAARRLGVEPVELLLAGGEDYELLFTVAPESGEQVSRLGEELRIKLSPVGVIEQGAGVYLRQEVAGLAAPLRREVSFSGYDHFKST